MHALVVSQWGLCSPSLIPLLPSDTGPYNYWDRAHIQPIVKVNEWFSLKSDTLLDRLRDNSNIFLLNHRGHIGFLNQTWSALNRSFLWNRLQSNSVSYLLVSLSRLCVLCLGQTPLQLHQNKKKSVSSLPLSVHGLASVTEQPYILNYPTVSCPLWQGSVLFNRFSPGPAGLCTFPVHCPAKKDLKSRPPDQLCGSQSTLCSLLFTLTPSWDSYRSQQPAIKSVNGSNTQTNV